MLRFLSCLAARSLGGEEGGPSGLDGEDKKDQPMLLLTL